MKRIINLGMQYVLMVLVVFAVVAADKHMEKKTVPVFNIGYLAQSGKMQKRLPIYSVDIPDKKLAISFNAAWGAEDTDILLKILADNDVLTTFFVCGSWVDKFPDDLKKLAAAGHDIANHGDKHAHVAQLNLEQNKQEIKGCHDKIKAVTGIEANLFRPPYGEYNNTVLDAAEALNYHTIQWDVDSHDWMAKGAEYELDRVLKNKNLKNGSIILFHNGAKFTPQNLDKIIKALKAQGYEIVPVSRLIYTDSYEIDHAGRQKVKQP